MITSMIEFASKHKDLLRGFLVKPDNKITSIIIFLHGFDRTSISEKKFKLLADFLSKKDIASFRFDFTGAGVSDGNFKPTTIESMDSDLEQAIMAVQKETGHKPSGAVAHSLGNCVLARNLSKPNTPFARSLLLAPAFNQQQLLRYWFVIGQMKENNEKTAIDWDNFREYLDENSFEDDCQINNKVARSHYIGSDYFMENKEKNYESELAATHCQLMHVHGDMDGKVPLKSLGRNIENSIIVKGGDHDLEKPEMIKQWLPQAVAFLAGAQVAYK